MARDRGGVEQNHAGDERAGEDGNEWRDQRDCTDDGVVATDHFRRALRGSQEHLHKLGRVRQVQPVVAIEVRQIPLQVARSGTPGAAHRLLPRPCLDLNIPQFSPFLGDARSIGRYVTILLKPT